ncbi:hypothetical protein FOA52_002602 [Chlamydomonas sp. UWO 241]|nr:hypothetical protein FOA52_002602 [Chlamydomonas sp. UWO 241]
MKYAVALVLGLLGLCGANAMYSSSDGVVVLTDDNFEAKVKAAGVMMVEFYAPWCGHCKSLQPEYVKLAKAMQGMAAVGAIDCDTHKAAPGQHGVKGFPTLKLFYVDSGKVKSIDYSAGRTAKDMVAFVFEKAKSLAMKRLGEKSGGGGGGGSGGGAKAGGGGGGGGDDSFYRGTPVVTLTDANFDEEVTNSGDLVLVEFYAPWCGHCKNLKQPWIESAGSLKGKVKMAAIDCTASQAACGKFGVQGYPTIKFFGKNKASPTDYQGGRDTASIVAFGTELWSKMAPPPEVKEIVDDHVFETMCTGDGDEVAAKQLCFIVFLPDLLDSLASGRNGYVKILKKIADTYKDRPFSYLWAGAGQQAALEANFGVGGFGYPALVAFKPKDGKFAVARTAFELKHVEEFIERIRKGGEQVLSMNGELAPIKANTPWDGKDAVVQDVEEFSLDDLEDDDEPKEEL